jgi:hypothetical protein
MVVRKKLSRQARIMMKGSAITASLIVLIAAAATVMPSCQRVSAGDQVRQAATVASLACIRTTLTTQEPPPNTLAELTVGSETQPALFREGNLQDSWGRPFQYRKTSETNFVLRSSGQDGRMGTRDDLL